MKILVASVLLTSLTFVSQAQANKGLNLEQFTGAVLQQQAAQVSHEVANLVQRDINYSLLTWKMNYQYGEYQLLANKTLSIDVNKIKLAQSTLTE